MPVFSYAILCSSLLSRVRVAAGERAQRLRDMGLLPGVGITVMGRSPMGDLLSLRVMGTTLALRVADAEDVTVSTDD